MPEFDAASELLRKHDPPVNLVKLDCTRNEQTMRIQQIMEFPTMKLFLDGKEHHYNGGRTRAHIVNWVNDRLQREVSALTHANIENIIEPHANDVVVIGALGSDVSLRQEFVRVSRMFDSAIFVDVPNVTLLNDVIKFHDQQDRLKPKTTVPSIILINPHSFHTGIRPEDEPRIVGFTGTITAAPPEAKEQNITDLEQFTKKYLFPSTATFSKEVAQLAFSDGRPIVVLCIPVAAREEEENKNLIDAFRTLALEFRGELLFTLAGVESVYERRLMGLLAIDEDEDPALRIITFNPKGNNHYHPALTFHGDIESFNKNGDPIIVSLRRFVASFKDGTLRPVLRSEQEPEEEDNRGPVKIIVGSNFEDLVIKSDRDIFIMFYAPWCGHCRKVEPALRMLGEKMNTTKSMASHFMIAKLDATRNEVPNLSFTGYPTLLLFRGDNKQNPLQFTGSRSVEEMMKFLATHGSHKFSVDEVLLADVAGRGTDSLKGDATPSQRARGTGSPTGAGGRYANEHVLSIYEEL